MHSPLTTHHSRLTNQCGFSLLYALLSSSLLMAIAVSLFNVAFKESLLTSVAQDSQFSFYAADAGIECALYWDFEHNAFDEGATPAPIQCMGVMTANPVGGVPHGTGPTQPAPQYVLSFDPESTSALQCVDLQVTKWEPNPGELVTIIESFGYNTCDTSSTRRVQRAIRVTF